MNEAPRDGVMSIAIRKIARSGQYPPDFNRLAPRYFMHHTSETALATFVDENGFEPIVASFVHVMERSILAEEGLENLKQYSVGYRKRYATCSGVAWLNDDHLAVVNLYGQHLRIYRFLPDKAKTGLSALDLLHETKQGLSYPETVAASPDGTMLAIAHSMSREHGLSLHRLDPIDYAPSTKCDMLRIGTFHGVCFSPDSRHLLVTEIHGSGYTEVINLASGTSTCLMANKLFPFKPKAISVSKDGRFVAIISSRNVTQNLQAGEYSGMVTVHPFERRAGLIDEMPIAELEYAGQEFSAIEACVFLKGRADGIHDLLAVDQANDQVLAFEFDSRNNKLRCMGVLSGDASFPHGIDVNPKGRYIATANYGDDTLRILEKSDRWPGQISPREAPRPRHTGYGNTLGPRFKIRSTTYSFRTWFPGRRLDPGKPTALLCGHSAGQRVFGAERSLLDLLDAFAAMPWNVLVTLPSVINPRYLDLVRARCHGVYNFGYRQFGHNSPSEPSVSMFSKIIAEHGVSIVHVNTTTLFEPLLAARRMKVKSIVHARELIDSDHYLWDQFGMPPAMLLARLSGIVDCVIANSRASRAVFANASSTYLLYNAVDAARFDMPNPLRDTIRFGMISSNLPKKGLTDFIDIARRCLDLGLNAEFVLIGPRNAHVKEHLQDRTQGDAPKNLRFLGYIDASRDAIAEMNVLFSLTHIAESFGRTVAESLAARRPVIAYRLGALPELVDDGASGFLIPCRDIAAAVECVSRFCRNPDLIQSMGVYGRSMVSKRFSKSAFATRLAEIYGQISAPNSSSASLP